MSSLTLTLKRFRLVPLLLCVGISLALNLWPALSQAQTVTLSVDPLFVHYSSPGSVTVTAELSAPRTEETTITLRLTGTADRGTDYTTDDSLPAITIIAGETSGSAPLSIGAPPDGMTERDIKTIIVRGRASGVSVSPATITLVKDNEAQDRAALQALYRATNGAGWTANTNWNSPAALNTWHGVTTNPDGRVVTLDLSANNLTGSIPPQVGGLAALQVLDLSNNNLTGSIPPQVGDLTALIHLDLSANKLSDSIPALNSLTALQVLDLNANDLTGSIPALNSLTALTHLDLNANNLTGSIPPQVGDLTALIHLDLSANKLSDSIPALNSLTALQVLDLSANNLTGSIPPPQVDDLPALTHLDLSANNLTGSIPALDSLITLLYLDLSNNALSGSIPALPALTHLDLSANDLSGSVPGIGRALPFLQFLDLSHNRFRGLLRLGLHWCPALLNLTHFDLSHNQLTGPVPASLGRLADLTHLDFSHNRFSGPLPVELGGTTNFTCDNDPELGGDEVDETRQLDDLTWLDLSNNALTGPVPASLGGLADLTHLDLSNNQLSGPIHPNLGRLGNLGVLTLDSDTGLCQTAALAEWLRRLGVTLPLCGAGDGAGEIDGDRAVLLALYRATNGAGWLNEVGEDRRWNPSASLNAWYGVTTDNDGQVTALHLDNNNLHGFIPPDLSDLPALQILDLSTNNLSGLIPDLSGLTDLKILHLHENRLRGKLPDSLLNLTLDALTLDDDTGLCRETAQAEEWLRRLGVTLPPCRATTESSLILTSEAPTSVPGQLLSVDEVNDFRLYIPGPGGILIVETTGDTDTFGSLTQEGTRAVTTDEDSGEDNNFRIAQPVSGDKWYSVAVSGGGEIGEYTLVVRYIPGVLENPPLGSFQSGIGVISGWVCEADQVVIEFERPGGTVWREPTAYGTSRPDTAGECGHSDSSFGLLWNWNKLGPGKHTVRALVDGVVLAEHVLIVTTLGLGEFPKGLHGDYKLEDFPYSGDTTRLLWQEAQQNFVIAAETGGETGGGHQNPGQAILGNPQPGSFQSGIGVISGWVCEAERIDIVFDPDTDNEMNFQAGYGTSRTDTSGKCGDSANGFGLLWNWNKLGPGQHTIRALADGFEFARSTFTVTTLGEEFARGLDSEYELEDFPEVGMTVTVKWQEALQNFTITGVK